PPVSSARPPDDAPPPPAAPLAVPDSVAPPALVPIATVTVPAKSGDVLPKASRAVRRTAGVMTDPAVRLVGCTVKTRCVAAPGVMAKAVLVEGVSPVALAASV